VRRADHSSRGVLRILCVYVCVRARARLSMIVKPRKRAEGSYGRQSESFDTYLTSGSLLVT